MKGTVFLHLINAMKKYKNPEERLVNQLRALGVNIKHVNHQMIVSDKKITVEKTGIVLD